MRRTSVNLIVDLTVAVLLLGMIATGYVLRFPLPPGTNKSHTLWGVTRHGWGSLHFWISVLLLTVLLAHVILHWHWLVSVIAKRLGRTVSDKRSVQIGLATGAALAVASVLFVWITWRSVAPITGAETGGTSEDLPKVSFSQDISAIFERACLDCHGPQRAAAGFRVDRQQDFFSKTDGGPLVIPGKSSDSPLIAIVSGRRSDLPRPDRHRLPAADVAVLRTWIDGGAEWPVEEDR